MSWTYNGWRPRIVERRIPEISIIFFNLAYIIIKI